ncbi:hypothetical protein CDL12_19431 [Handroanthus impetiginosus]|uniref:Uncharacterized protein n=1 Tax=Handroanthus impetiginosus TaxID=429701 RepID=A0A2G9GRX1_9LAMI|nr:hypothetical protein CDL12_19431 [Handroanthus impetiginosus]
MMMLFYQELMLVVRTQFGLCYLDEFSEIQDMVIEDFWSYEFGFVSLIGLGGIGKLTDMCENF